MSRVLLVRHGESTWNAAGRWQGQADPPLSARGEAQARAAAPALAALGPFAAVYASPLRRALRTAQLLLRQAPAPLLAGRPPAPVRAGRPPAPLRAGRPPADEPRPVPGLEERDAGPWTGLTHAEIDRRHPGARASGWRPEGYEAEAALRARASAALQALAGEPLLVVLHEGVLRALDRDPAPLPNLGARWFAVDAAGVRPDGPRLALAPG